MKSLVKRKSLIAILSAICAFFMLFAGLSVKKASAATQTETLETVALTTTMEDTASMRLTDPTGMRFTVNVQESDITNFNADNVKVVIMITQKNLLDEAGLTVATFDKDSAVTKAEISFTKDEFPAADNGTVKLIATILRVKDENISKTYVAKTYITDGEKIGYVTQATEASIYEIASYWANQDLYKDNAEAMAILQGYSKSCNVTINANEAVKVPYYSEVSELFADLPACTTVKSIVDSNSESVALNASVTADLALTVEYSVNHAWENGECTHCEEVCEHSYTNGVCNTCELKCEHPSLNGLVCNVCAQTTPATYNACATAESATAYRYAYSPSYKDNNDSFKYDTVTSAGGRTGNFLQVLVGRDSNGVGSQWVGITIAPDLTLTQIQALQKVGYGKFSVDYYLEHESGATSTHKAVYTGIIPYGQSGVSDGRTDKNLGEWYNFTLSIQDVIDNYESLKNGTVYLIGICNSNGYDDMGYTQADGYERFYVYIGGMEFLMDTAYNSCDNENDVKAYASMYTAGYAADTVGLNWRTTNSAGGVAGNFLRIGIGKDSNGNARQYVGISIAPDLTKEQIKALEDAGYTQLRVDYYLENTGGPDAEKKTVYSGSVFPAGLSDQVTGYDANKTMGEWHHFTVDIQKIIENYDGLVSGTHYLMAIRNSHSYGECPYESSLGYNTFATYIGNMQFIKE